MLKRLYHWIKNYRPSLKGRWLLLLLLISGCGNGWQEEPILQDMRTMFKLYGNYTSKGFDFIRQRYDHRSQKLAPQTSVSLDNASREIEQLFPKIYNPTLWMYVVPHLSGPDGVPIPGYITAFRLYEKDYFALPGEPVAP